MATKDRLTEYIQSERGARELARLISRAMAFARTMEAHYDGPDDARETLGFFMDEDVADALVDAAVAAAEFDCGLNHDHQDCGEQEVPS